MKQQLQNLLMSYKLPHGNAYLLLYAETLSANVPLEKRAMIQEKRRLRRDWQLSLHPQDKTALNKATVELKEAIKTVNKLTMQAK